MIRKKILITGAAGFIGQNITKRLLLLKYKITGIDNFSNLYPLFFYKNRVNNLCMHENFNFFKTDILDKKSVFTLIKNHKFDYLIHCAAKTGVAGSLEKPKQYLETNVIGTVNLLEVLRFYSPQTKSILLSSSSVYGKQDASPLIEDMVPQPLSPYGLSKYMMELIAEQYHKLYKLPILIVRPFSIFGPDGRLDMAPYLAIRSAQEKKPFIIYGNNENNQRSWTYIDDFVDGIVSIIHKENLFRSFSIYNLGNEKSIGIQDFADIAKKLIMQYLHIELTIKKKRRRSFEMSINRPSIEKAKKDFRYYPKISFEVGFKKVLECYIVR